MKGFFCKITLALCFVIFVGSAARADEVTFSANAPMVVTAGESFRVEFSLNATPDDDSFEAPDFGAFDVLAVSYTHLDVYKRQRKGGRHSSNSFEKNVRTASHIPYNIHTSFPAPGKFPACRSRRKIPL